jgi:ABC-type glycerol-3-phosphate transport system substrate-binding protein
MSGDQQPTVSRRSFLTVAAAAGAASLIAACGTGTAPAAPKIAGNTPAPAAAGTPAAPAAAAPSGAAIFTLVDKTFADVGAQAATDVYNKNPINGKAITIEDGAAGWDAKVLPQVRDKNLRWSGCGYVPFFDQYKHIKAGLFQPLDDLLKSSKVPWAAKQKEVYFAPKIYETLLLDGKQYFVPMKHNVHIAGWRVDYLKSAGYDTLPKTWDEIDKMLPKIKAANADVIPFAIQRDLFRAIGTAYSTFIEKPLDEQGVFRVDTPEWNDLMTMFKKWVDAGLARFETNDDAVNAWQKGKYALSLSSHSWVRLGRQVWGKEKVAGGIPPQANANAPARTWSHIDGAGVFPGAPDGQAALDWMLSIYGPEGEAAETWWSKVLTFSGQPVFQSVIDKFVKTNPDISEVGEIMTILPNSQTVSLPQASGYIVTQTKLPPYLDKIFSGEMSIKEGSTKAREEILAELAKQKSG